MARHTVIPAVHLFLLKNKKILLSRRFQTGYEDGKYSVPAGHVEPGETATIAIIREAKEEVGISILPENLQIVHVMHRTKIGQSEERVDFFFLCSNWEGTIANNEPNKCDNLHWFATEQLPDNTIPYVRTAIENYQNSIFYCEYGWHGEP